MLQRGSDPSVWNATNVPVGKEPEGGDISPDGREYFQSVLPTFVNAWRKKVSSIPFSPGWSKT